MSVQYSSEKSQRLGEVVVTGTYSYVSVDSRERDLLLSGNVLLQNGKVKNFHKAIYKGVIFCSRAYSEDKTFDDSCVMLADLTYAVIDKFVASADEQLMCVVKPIRIAPNDLLPNIKNGSEDGLILPCS